MAALSLRGIKKSYDKVNHVIPGIDLEVQPGEFVVFVGPSGCGKSTLLRMIAGLEEITGGDLEIGGVRTNDMEPAKRGIAMVFQSYALYPHMTVAENMGFGLKLSGMPKAEVQKQVQRAAETLQITHLLDRKPKALSGGQRQRVAIGRAIVRKPKVFLFDEPLSNLDAALRVQMRIELAKLHKELQATMVYVTHDQVEAMTLGDRIVVFNAGRIEQAGAPLELYERPANLFVAGFLGSPKMNFIPATVDQVTADGVTLRIANGALIKTTSVHAEAKPGDEVTLGVRPEHLDTGNAGQAGNVIDATVDFVEHLGDAMIVYWQLQGQRYSLKLGSEAGAPAPSGPLRLHAAPARCHVFDKSGSAYQRI